MKTRRFWGFVFAIVLSMSAILQSVSGVQAAGPKPDPKDRLNCAVLVATSYKYDGAKTFANENECLDHYGFDASVLPANPSAPVTTTSPITTTESITTTTTITNTAPSASTNQSAGEKLRAKLQAMTLDDAQKNLAQLFPGSKANKWSWRNDEHTVWGYWDKDNPVTFTSLGLDSMLTYWSGFAEPETSRGCWVQVPAKSDRWDGTTRSVQCPDPGATFKADGVGFHPVAPSN